MSNMLPFRLIALSLTVVGLAAPVKAVPPMGGGETVLDTAIDGVTFANGGVHSMLGFSGPCGDGSFFEPAGKVCRGSAGICDLVETCSGTSPVCPPDEVEGTGVICRISAGQCDLTETCDGVSAACPVDVLRSTAFVCRSASVLCDVSETCDGASVDCPEDAFESAGSTCRLAAGDCDVAEMCTGASAGCPEDVLSTGECRASAGVCDLAEVCDDVSPECPADILLTHECRPSAGACDIAESCDGVSADCPADAVKPSTTVCRAATGDCDVEETCDGAMAGCPDDVFESESTPCDDGLFCTDPDRCDGLGNCTGGDRCDDSKGCTEDTCDETGMNCANEPACVLSGETLYNQIVTGPSDMPDPDNPIDDVDMTLSGGSSGTTSTSNDGSYSFSNQDGTITVTPSRDATPADIAIALGAEDASEISRASVGLVAFTPKQITAGDVSGNGELSAYDASLVARRMVGLDGSFPGLGGATWFFVPADRTADVTMDDVSGVDFCGVIYGDVTMNWAGPTTGVPDKSGASTEVDTLHAAWADLDPDAVSQMALAPSKETRLYVAQGPRMLRDGGFEMVLGLSDADGVLGLDLSLVYDPTNVSIDSVTAAGLAIGFQLDANRLAAGAYGIALFSPIPLQGTGDLLVVRMRIEGPLTGWPFEMEGQVNEGAIRLLWGNEPAAYSRRNHEAHRGNANAGSGQVQD